MSVADPVTGLVLPMWRRHFARSGRPVPHGEPGSNPGRLSKSTDLQIVHAFGQLHAVRHSQNQEGALTTTAGRPRR